MNEISICYKDIAKECIAECSHQKQLELLLISVLERFIESEGDWLFWLGGIDAEYIEINTDLDLEDKLLPSEIWFNPKAFVENENFQQYYLAYNLINCLINIFNDDEVISEDAINVELESLGFYRPQETPEWFN